jgi:hypothetical protein
MFTRWDVTAFADLREFTEEDNGTLSPERWERLRRRWAAETPEPPRYAADVRRAYEEATGTCIGCE